MNLKDWTGTHPISGAMLVGTVVILTENNNINLNQNNTNANTNKTEKSEVLINDDLDGEDF
jgi:hypothetical protein